MKLIYNNDNSSLLIDNIERTENRIDFDVSVVLYDKRTDTDIKFKTKSYIDIDDWQQKSETLLLQDKIELENFSYYAKYDKTIYPWNPSKRVTVQNHFVLSSGLNKSCIKFTIETDLFTKTLSEEIGKIIKSQPAFDKTTTANKCSKDKLIHIKLKIVRLYTDGRCDLQLRVYSDNFHIVRMFDDDYEGAIFTAEEIKQFNNRTIERIERIVYEFLEMEFYWIDGKKMGKGTINDFAWPGPNELIFDDIVDIEWEHVDKEDLPLIPTEYIPADEFQVGSRTYRG